MASLIGKRVFHAPPTNVDLFGEHGRRIYYRCNLEHVDGILGTSNGGTGNTDFNNDELIIYSNGKFISSGVSKSNLSDMGKISGITTHDGEELEIDGETKMVSLPDYLLKTGGTISGDLEVTQGLTVGNINIHFDSDSQCVAFTMIG